MKYKLNGRKLEFTFGEAIYQEIDDSYEKDIYLNGEFTNYAITMKGSVISYAGKNNYKGRKLSPYISKKEKRIIGNLVVNKERYSFSVDRLVTEAFLLDAPEESVEIIYLDDDFSNVNVENLLCILPDGTEIFYENGVRKIEKINSV